MRKTTRFVFFFMLIFILTGLPAVAEVNIDDSGALLAMNDKGEKLGKCPLKHTQVEGDISGFFAKVTVTQHFTNPFDKKIEALYTFPLPEDAAVYEMEMRVGDRIVKGKIKRKEEAKKIYDEARRQGKVASLLDQERPNIFTQHVANIEPGVNVEIIITYLDTLKYDDGGFTFVFPTVVGPRFTPLGHAASKDRTSAKVTPKGTRAGHDIDISVHIDAGMKISGLTSELHEVNIDNKGENSALISLKKKDSIPNRDFILRWQVAEAQLKSGVLLHKTGQEDGYFVLVMVPPKRPTREQIQPREMIFVVDRSGSQRGLPLEKAKDTLLYILDNMNPNDTFQVIDFASGYHKLFEKPQPWSEDMVKKAQTYIKSISANGGTQMEEAVRAACAEPTEEHRLRIVTLMTDGLIGDDLHLVKMVKELRGNSRWFPFGTGNSVNRFLIEKLATAGSGEADFVLLSSDSETVAKKFYERIQYPILTDIKLKFEGVKVNEVYPAQPTDLWARKPIILKGRYSGHGKGAVIISGYHGGSEYQEKIEVDFPNYLEANGQITQIWARGKIGELMQENWTVQYDQQDEAKAIKEKITVTALKYSLMSQFTSFVAVEESHVTKGGEAVVVEVPVEMPEGVSYEGIFGDGMVMREESDSFGMGAPGGMLNSVAKFSRSAPRPMSVKPSIVSSESSHPAGTIYPEVKKKDFTKISSELTALVNKMNAGKLTDSEQVVQMRIEFTAYSKELKAFIKQNAARVVFLSEKGGKVIVKIHLNHLKKLAQFKEITVIKLEK